MNPDPSKSDASAPPLCVEVLSCDPALDWSRRVRVVALPRPELKTGEVRVGMLAMTINPADLLQLSGAYGVKPSLPYVPGHEGVAVVLEAGPGVDGWKPGQRALVIANGGYWLDERVVSHRQLVPLDDTLDPLQCAMLTANPATAWVLLRQLVELGPDDVVVLNAANSAVGQCVRQLAAHWGIATLNVVRRASAVIGPESDSVRWLVDDGQDRASFVRAVKDAAAGRRVRLALDAVGGQATAHLAACVDEGASVVVYGLLSAEDPVVPSHDLVFRNVRLQGFWLARWFADAANRAAAKTLYPALSGLLQQGVLEVAVEATYPLDQVAAALAHADRPNRTGKVLLTGRHALLKN